MQLTPMPHQTDGVAFLLNGGSLLAYDQGTGKTATAIWAALEDGAYATLIGCPSVVTGNWEKEILMLDPNASVLILTSATVDKDLSKYDYVIVSLDLVGRNPRVRAAVRRRWTHLIIDEAHMLKTFTSQRAQAWLVATSSVSGWAEKVWLLTGTPTPNHAGELWPLIVGTAEARLRGKTAQQFEDYYCRHKLRRIKGGRKIRVVAGTNMARIKQLRADLNGWWARVRKEDVLKDLPPKVTNVVPVEATNLGVDYEEFMDSPEGAALVAAIEGGNMNMAEIGEDDSLSRFRRLLAYAKADMATQYVKYLLDGGSPGVLVWFWHTDAMKRTQDALEAGGIATCAIDGSTPAKKRTEIVAQFQADDGPKVFLGQIRAAGVGITLTKADRVVFAEMDWVPANNAQASDRAHRIGQEKQVIVDILAVRDSVDYGLLVSVARKMEETSAIWETDDEDQD